MRSRHAVFLAIVMVASLAGAVPTGDSIPVEESVNRIGEFFLSDNNLALEGYDPLTYFSGDPRVGDASITATYKGIQYRFRSQENRHAFLANPSKYEPQYGGWCAWAMYKDGSKVEPDPESYLILDDKLYLFYDGLFSDTRKKWRKEAVETGNEQEMIATADENWRRILDEGK